MSREYQELVAGRLARRSEAFGRSPWTFIDQFMEMHPDLIYFGNGAPAPELYPIEFLQAGAINAWDKMDASALDYGELQGYAPLRHYISDRMNAQGFDVSPENILITFGSQQGIDIAARLALDPGDHLAAEAPTYIGAMQAFDAYEPTYRLYPVDDEGFQVESMVQDVRESGIAPKLIYVIPNYQNPTGQTMSDQRRNELIAFAREHGSIIVEDDPYGEFWYDAPPPGQLRCRWDQVIYLGTFSKLIAPGLRVGWMVIPDHLMGRALMAKESSEVCGVRTITRTVYQAAPLFLESHVAEGRAFYKQRRDTTMSALNACMPGTVRWSEPGGGFFVWITLPEGQQASALLPVAARHGVGFLPGRFFTPAAVGDDGSLRLSFSSLPEERLREGIKRLADAIQAYDL